MQDMALRPGIDTKISPMSRSNKHQAANQKSVVCLLAGCLVELVSLGVLRRAIEESLEVEVDFEKNKRVREDLEKSVVCLLAGCLVELVSLGVLRRAIEESWEVDVDFEKNKRVREDLEALAPARLRVVQLLQYLLLRPISHPGGILLFALKKSEEKKRRRGGERKKKKIKKKRKEKKERDDGWMDRSIDVDGINVVHLRHLLKEEIDSCAYVTGGMD
ncbi:unnamed protein product [Clavelina lepadiformis]|uniref:Uncharacterized protein n=1 Tax=Clavelina lepadiformis TaxID=159417 RepID=A0ABP0GSU2_CLALP